MVLDTPREKNVSVCLHPLHRASHDSKAWSIKTHINQASSKFKASFLKNIVDTQKPHQRSGTHCFLRGCGFPALQVCALHRLGSLTQLWRWGSRGLQEPPQGPWLTSLNLQGQQSVLFLHVSQEQLEKWIRNKIPLLYNCKITTYPGISLRKCRIFM